MWIRVRSMRLFAFVIIAMMSAMVANAAQAVGENFLVPQEDQMQGLVNDTRASRGLTTLPTNEGLRWMARRQAQAMSAAGNIYHTADLAGAANAQNLDWLNLGENVGIGPSVQAVQEAFLNSPGHLANIVKPSYNAVGVGATADSREALFFTQSFATLNSGGPAPKVAPAVKAAKPPATIAPRPATTVAPQSLTPAPPSVPTPEPSVAPRPQPTTAPTVVGPNNAETGVRTQPKPERPSIFAMLVSSMKRFVEKITMRG